MPRKHTREGTVITTKKIKVFLSWSGNVGKELASSFQDVIQGVFKADTFFSQDIPVGDEWGRQIRRALRQCQFSFIFLTPESINSDWVLFETGALWRHYEKSRVCPILIGLNYTRTPAPLQMLQAVSFDLKKSGETKPAYSNRLKNQCRKLFESLDKALEQNRQSSQNFGKQFNKFVWPNIRPGLEKALTTISQEDGNAIVIQLAEERAKVSRLDERLRMLASSVGSPAYFMDEEFNILYMNTAAEVVFGLEVPVSGSLKIGDFISALKKNIENYDEVLENFNTNFCDKSKVSPRKDFEKVIYKHPKYGTMHMRKIGLALIDPPSAQELGTLVPGPKRSGWVVTYNLESVENSDKYFNDVEFAAWGRVRARTPLFT